MKKIISIAAFILVIVLPGFIMDRNTSAQEKSDTEYLEPIQIDEIEISRGVATTSQAFHYSSIEELVNDSDLIIYGKIKSWDSYVDSDLGSFMYTNYEFDLTDVIYGEVNEEDFILTEIGGIISSDEYWSGIDMDLLKKDFEPDSVYEEQAKYKWISFSIDWAYDVLPLDKDFIIFCKKSTEGENAYYPVGNYQGVFIGEQGGEEFSRMLHNNTEDELVEITMGDVVERVNE